MLVDVEGAIQELGLAEEDYQEFLGDLSDFLKQALPDLKDLIDAHGNSADIESQAHSVKGALRNLRFVGAAEVAAQLEYCAAGKIPGDLNDLYQQFLLRLQESFSQLKLPSPV